MGATFQSRESRDRSKNAALPAIAKQRWQLDRALCVALAGGSHRDIEVAETMIKANASNQKEDKP